jgi:5'-deoxynucleotidase YfbR-like HD superfamily hydrolase
MPKNPIMQEILKQIEFLFEHYSLERRATTQPYLLKVAQEQLKGYSYHPDDDLVRETLIEHVGSLPMLGTALYPYINDPEVDLGQSLIMMAIHDIGELITGDEMVFTKKADSHVAEREAAIKLLHPMYHDIYDDAETKASKSAKFAKSIDKINPDIIDYLMPPEITKWRYKEYVGIEPDQIVETIVKYKRPHMLWNPFMTDFHIYLLKQLDKRLRS